MRAAKAKGKLRLRATVSPNLLQPSTTTPTLLQDSTITPPLLQDSTLMSSLLQDPTNDILKQVSAPCRGSTAFDQRSVGTGIFQFREPTVESTSDKSEHLPEPDKAPVAKLHVPESDEAPVPKPFAIHNPVHNNDKYLTMPALESHRLEHDPAIVATKGFQAPSWIVYCNKCDNNMDDVHFHCSVCDGGDYDLCQSCVDNGTLCLGNDHWLIKRNIVNGKIVSSTTERLAPKRALGLAQPTPIEVEKIENISTERDMPGAFADDTRTLNDDAHPISRTCNSCIDALPDRDFVTCTSCDDFDLCHRCIVDNKHGHHPAHRFVPTSTASKLRLVEEAMLNPGRNVRHRAICDGCDQNIFGVRHKCFSCPDFDYCDDCVKNARKTHPRHVFAPIYEPVSLYQSASPAVVHHGIYCDSPLCTNQDTQTYIQGVRYKCVVCSDTDFCASCEASPLSTHNKSHPLVKFKTPVKNVTISTENSDRTGKVRHLGDAGTPPSHKHVSHVTAPVKTVADIEPSQKTEVPQQRRPFFYSPSAAPPAPPKEEAPLEALFVRDTVLDGTIVAPDTRFAQIWTLRNPGPRAWPSGCSVRFVGGDNMLNYDSKSALSDINEATESNVTAREVQAGEEISFRVLLKAPLRVGQSISYWRLKSAEGMPFGHKLWCDVNVKNIEDVVAESEDTKLGPNGSNAASYWKNYQQGMASIRLANAQKQQVEQRMQLMDLTTKVQRVRDHAVQQRAQLQHAIKACMESCEHQPKGETESAANDDVSKTDVSNTKTTSETVVTSQEQQQDEGELSDSQMIFPTLVRESPSGSTCAEHGSPKPAFVEDEETGVKLADAGMKSLKLSPASAPVQVSDEEEEAFEDISELEVLSADGDEGSDDGFMTDEEYDILDASDQETVASM